MDWKGFLKKYNYLIIVIILLMLIFFIFLLSGFIFGPGIMQKIVIFLAIEDLDCNPTNGITVWVKNEGTETSGKVTVTIDYMYGDDKCTIPSLEPDIPNSCTIPGGSPGQGYHEVIVTTPGAKMVNGSVYCPA